MRRLDELNGHESKQASGDGEGQGSLVCCSPWGCKELDTTEQLNNNLISWLSVCLEDTLSSSLFLLQDGAYISSS